MADDRTRREKLEAMANDPGATQGERDNARRILEKMGPAPKKERPRASGSFNFGSGSFDFGSDYEDLIRRAEERLRREQAQARQAYGFRDRWGRTAWDQNQSLDKEALRRTIRDLNDEALKELVDLVTAELARRDELRYTDREAFSCAVGGHTWVVVGTALNLEPINRCMVCGEYEARMKKGAKKKSHNLYSFSDSDHDWVDDHKLPDDPWRWTQRCTGCTVTRMKPAEGSAK